MTQTLINKIYLLMKIQTLKLSSVLYILSFLYSQLHSLISLSQFVNKLFQKLIIDKIYSFSGLVNNLPLIFKQLPKIKRNFSSKIKELLQKLKNIKGLMYGRNKIDTFDTINLCNQFLILHLAKKAQAFENRGLLNNSRVYRNAIYSIKRYPLPIICKVQLQSINGIGQFLSQQLQKVIKNHYSAFLDHNLKPKFPQHQSDNSDNQIFKQNPQNRQRLQRQQNNQNSLTTTKSVASQYKPRINTLNSYFLQILAQLNGTQTNIPKNIPQNIMRSQVLKKYPTTKNKGWKSLEQTLQSNGYIKIESIKQQEKQSKQNKLYQLTEKGFQYTKSLTQKNKSNEAKSKIINHVKLFKEEILYNSNNVSNKQASNLNNFCLNNGWQKQSDKITPKLLQMREDDISLDKLTLLIDNREKNQKAQTNFFLQKITKKYNIRCENASLNLGDFLWVYDNKVLDYIIERKKADDLAASILDGRYKDQKHRLHQSGVTNIYYIYEGYPSDNCCLTEKQLNSALLKTRAKEKFKVFQTKDINETMKLLNTFHLQIYEKILFKKARYLCSFQQFNEMNSVQRNFTVGKIFALGLMAIPGVGKNSVTVVTQYFKTYKAMHDYLKKLDSNFDRVQFLKQLFKGSGMMQTLPGILVELLFSENYCKQMLLQPQSYHSTSISFSQSYQKQELNFEQQLERVQKKKRFSIIHEQQEINSDNEDNRNQEIEI